MKAAAKYDSERGLRFVNYAVVFIRQQIEKALKQESAELRVENAKDGLSRSVDAPLGNKANMSLLSVLSDVNSPLADVRVYDSAIADAVEYALRSLSEREHQVIAAYYGIEQEHLTMAEIAEDTDVAAEAEKNELSEQLLKCISELGYPDSVIIIQKYYYSRSSKEIAEMTGLNAAGVRVRCGRAMKRLKKLLEENGITL
jgi:RNA polymerase sigma factor (sigma-70 family)